MNLTNKIIIGIVSIIVIAAGVWMAAPLFYDKKVSEELPTELQTATPSAALTSTTTTPQATITSRSGVFTGFDELHQGSGTTTVSEASGKTFVRFEDNFTVTNGPDLYVYLGKNGKYDPNTNLGKLKGNIGSQNYEVPAGINAKEYDEVWVWCRAFSVPFAKARLQ